MQNIGPNHLYGRVIPSVVDVIDLDGIRARVGAAIQSPPESVHPGAATTTIARLGPFEFYNF